jgi:hypothetical protein
MSVWQTIKDWFVVDDEEEDSDDTEEDFEDNSVEDKGVEIADCAEAKQ